MRTKKNLATVLVECNDNQNDTCNILVNSLEKRYRRNVKAVYKTIPFSNSKLLAAKLTSPDSIKLGRADFIIELAATKHNDLERIKRIVQYAFPRSVAHVEIK